MPAVAASTDTSLPTPTETVPPTQTFSTLPIISPTVTPAIKPDYACDIINQKPLDDSSFRPNDDFDIKWTIVNVGTQKWEDDTYLEYQSGPQMTDVTKVELPRLKPSEQYDVILDATAPAKLDRQIMVWAIKDPGTAKNSIYWMCYPYVRIVVENK